ncbi:MAG: hypothetical protein WC532_06740 [Candidatus Omnitrophota bacterium]
MKKTAALILTAIVCSVCFAYAEMAPAPTPANEPAIKTIDVNKDGAADVTYYGDGKNITRAEADTNYDGKPDVIVHVKDGKFDSAEADTNNDGQMDKKFSDTAAFNQWLNENSPDFNDHLNRPDWQFDLVKF